MKPVSPVLASKFFTTEPPALAVCYCLIGFLRDIILYAKVKLG